MGQHTWFEKDRTLYEEQEALYKALDAHDNGETYLDELDILAINARINEIDELNNAEYHDIFRTNKRNEDGTYTEDVIYSKKECDKWLENNKHSLKEEDKHFLDEFWDKYPDGVIYFG